MSTEICSIEGEGENLPLNDLDIDRARKNARLQEYMREKELAKIAQETEEQNQARARRQAQRASTTALLHASMTQRPKLSKMDSQKENAQPQNSQTGSMFTISCSSTSDDKFVKDTSKLERQYLEATRALQAKEEEIGELHLKCNELKHEIEKISEDRDGLAEMTIQLEVM